jgi:hypothetical protein
MQFMIMLDAYFTRGGVSPFALTTQVLQRSAGDISSFGSN